MHLLVFENHATYSVETYTTQEDLVEAYLGYVHVYGEYARLIKDVNVRHFCKLNLEDESNKIMSLGIVGLSEEANESIMNLAIEFITSRGFTE
jgi:hypothetical protein